MSNSWPQWVAELIRAGDSGEFWCALQATLKTLLPFDGLLVLAYHRDNRPDVLFANISEANIRVLHNYHLQGGYLVAPYFLANRRAELNDGVYRIEDVAPEGFLQSDYHRHYFCKTGLRSELAFVSRVNPNTSIMVSCGSYHRSYRQEERRDCAYVAPVICELVRSRYRRIDAVSVTSNAGRIHQELASAQQNFGRSRLSVREQEVVQLILRGHSIKSIAEKLGISCGTVKVHRKNIYVKLDVCSQSDLFSLFLSALGVSLDTQGNQGEDPLTVYWPRSTNHPRT